MMFTMQLMSNRLNFAWILSILTRNLFEIRNQENCNSSKSKIKFANSQFANRDSATNCTTRFLTGQFGVSRYLNVLETSTINQNVRNDHVYI